MNMPAPTTGQHKSLKNKPAAQKSRMTVHPAYLQLMCFVEHSLNHKTATLVDIRSRFSNVIDCFQFWGFDVFGPRSRDNQIHKAISHISRLVCKQRDFPLFPEYNAKGLINTKAMDGAMYTPLNAIAESETLFGKGEGKVYDPKICNDPINKTNISEALVIVHDCIEQRMRECSLMRPWIAPTQIGAQP